LCIVDLTCNKISSLLSLPLKSTLPLSLTSPPVGAQHLHTILTLRTPFFFSSVLVEEGVALQPIKSFIVFYYLALWMSTFMYYTSPRVESMVQNYTGNLSN